VQNADFIAEKGGKYALYVLSANEVYCRGAALMRPDFGDKLKCQSILTI